MDETGKPPASPTMTLPPDILLTLWRAFEAAPIEDFGDYNKRELRSALIALVGIPLPEPAEPLTLVQVDIDDALLLFRRCDIEHRLRWMNVVDVTMQTWSEILDMGEVSVMVPANLRSAS